MLKISQSGAPRIITFGLVLLDAFKIMAPGNVAQFCLEPGQEIALQMDHSLKQVYGAFSSTDAKFGKTDSKRAR